MKLFRGFDWSLILVVFLLSTMSLAVIFDISRGDFNKQLGFVMVGFGLVFLVSFLDYRFLKNASFSLYIGMVVILLAVLLFGSEVRGTRSWFGIGEFGLQPVELVKLIMIVVLARYLSRFSSEIHRVKHVFISGAFVAIPSFLILLQPDLGSVMVLLSIWLIMLLISGLRWRHLIVFLLIALILFGVSWQWGLKDYQKDRLVTFVDPYGDPLGQGYNVIQSVIAIGSGGLFGKGLGYGTQSQLNFLPEKHTDFIFAVVAEELGLIGVFFLLSFYLFLFWRIYLVAQNARDNFSRFLAVGILLMLIFHVIINVAMNLGVFPVVGIPLTFLSYGGSNIIVSFIALGVLQNIRRNSIVW